MSIIWKVIIACALCIILVFTLGHFHEGFVRYPCQLEENWNKPECNVPQCLAEGSCTKDLYPSELWKEMGIKSE